MAYLVSCVSPCTVLFAIYIWMYHARNLEQLFRVYILSNLTALCHSLFFVLFYFFVFSDFIHWCFFSFTSLWYIVLEKNNFEMLITKIIFVCIVIIVSVKLQSYTYLWRSSGTIFFLGRTEIICFGNGWTSLSLNTRPKWLFLYRWSFIPKKYESSRFWEVRAQLFTQY